MQWVPAHLTVLAPSTVTFYRSIVYYWPQRSDSVWATAEPMAMQSVL